MPFAGEATFGLSPAPAAPGGGSRGALRSTRCARAARRARGSRRGSPRRASPGSTAPLGRGVNFRLRPALPYCETSTRDAVAAIPPSPAFLDTRTHALMPRQSCSDLFHGPAGIVFKL